MSFVRLFEPLTIGVMTIRNRIFMAPHAVSFLPGYGSSIDRIVDYHIERAKGGAGLIVMSNYIMPPSWRLLASWGDNLSLSPLGGLDLVSDPALIPAYRRLVQGVHGYGAKFVSQLNAGGRQLYSPGMASYGIPLLAPSPIPCPITRHIPKEMEIADIEEFVASFADASANLQEAEADGVEILAAQGYLLSEFLSPQTNRRTDHYGGSLENRMRFLLDAIRAVRAKVGKAFVIGVRLNGDDFSAGGLTLDMACDVAQALAASSSVDYLSISGMTYLHYPAWIADATAPDAPFVPLAAKIKQCVPKMIVGVATKIGSPAAAEDIIATGAVDMVGMARALIADPEWPNKAMRNDVADIRGCTYSNQSCLMGLVHGRGVSCLHNVAVGKEAQFGIDKMRPARRGKQVMIVGGGPAGMAAARIAAERGHTVTLFEKDAMLGGQNRLTAQLIARKGFAEVTRWLEHRIRRAGVVVRPGISVTLSTVREMTPDVVIVATGSRPKKSGYSGFRPHVATLPGVDQGNVLTLWDVLQTPDRCGKKVLVIDEDPHMAAAFVAEHLADCGKHVTIATPQIHIARDLALSHIPELYERLHRKGVDIRSDTVVVAIDDNTVRMTNRYTGADLLAGEFETVVLAMGNEPQDTIYHELKAEMHNVVLVGDCLAPRKIDDAIADGERAGWMI